MTPTPDPTLAAPATIYLQDGGDYADAHEVTWCQHSVDDADTVYIRLDLHTAAVQAAVAKAVEACAVDAMAAINACREDGETDLRSVRAWVDAAIRARKGDAL